MPVDRLREVVGNGKKQIKAFNLCDGTLNQAEVAKKCNMDRGNLSRTLARWRENGVLFVLGERRNATFLHIYPLPPEKKKKAAK